MKKLFFVALIILASCTTTTAPEPTAQLKIYMQWRDFITCRVDSVTVKVNGKLEGYLRHKGNFQDSEVSVFVVPGNHRYSAESTNGRHSWSDTVAVPMFGKTVRLVCQ
jgi:hypothetical protein